MRGLQRASVVPVEPRGLAAVAAHQIEVAVSVDVSERDARCGSGLRRRPRGGGLHRSIVVPVERRGCPAVPADEVEVAVSVDVPQSHAVRRGDFERDRGRLEKSRVVRIDRRALVEIPADEVEIAVSLHVPERKARGLVRLPRRPRGGGPEGLADVSERFGAFEQVPTDEIEVAVAVDVSQHHTRRLIGRSGRPARERIAPCPPRSGRGSCCRPSSRR